MAFVAEVVGAELSTFVKQNSTLYLMTSSFGRILYLFYNNKVGKLVLLKCSITKLELELKVCNLCLVGKYAILAANDDALLSKRTELVNTNRIGQ